MAGQELLLDATSKHASGPILVAPESSGPFSATVFPRKVTLRWRDVLADLYGGIVIPPFEMRTCLSLKSSKPNYV